jgi:hypothetical protein
LERTFVPKYYSYLLRQVSDLKERAVVSETVLTVDDVRTKIFNIKTGQ